VEFPVSLLEEPLVLLVMPEFKALVFGHREESAPGRLREMAVMEMLAWGETVKLLMLKLQTNYMLDC
jgi:hypothetical protein